MEIERIRNVTSGKCNYCGRDMRNLDLLIFPDEITGEEQKRFICHTCSRLIEEGALHPGEELDPENPDHVFVVRKSVRPQGGSGGVTLPKSWIGKIVRCEIIEEE